MDYQAANEFMAKRLTMLTNKDSREIADSIPPKVRAQCFFSARVAKWRIAKKLKEGADAVARGELSVDEARVHLQRWMDANRIGDKTSTRIGNISSTGRLNLILTQNAKMAAAVGRYQVSRDPDIEERWPCWRYIAGPNPRPAHAVHDGKVYRKSDPFWATHYPPWDFNCNCDVEDSDAPPQTAPRDDGKPPESGYQFSPADAFGTYDLSSITDPETRFRTREGMEIELGDRLVREGLTLRVSGRRYDTWEDKKLSSAKTWDAAPSPEKIAPEEARKKLEKGAKIRTPDNSIVTLDREVMRHWKIDGGKLTADINSRLRSYHYAVETLRAADERWDQETQRRYLKIFRKPGGGMEGCMVVVTNDGTCRTYFLPSVTQVNRARNGISFEAFGKKE